MRPYFRTLGFVSFLLAAPIARRAAAEPPTTPVLQDLAESKTVPQKLTLKELGAGWQRFNATTTTNGTAQLLAMMGAPVAEGETFYTRGQVVMLGSTTFLVAYRANLKRVNWMEMMQGKKTLPETLSPDTSVAVTLLNFALIGTISELSQFDLATELAASQKLAAQLAVDPGFAQERDKGISSASQSNLKQVSLAMAQYAQDNDNLLPPMTSAAELKKALMPYVKTDAVFVHPGTGEAYLPNPFLQGKKWENVVLNPRGDQLATAEIVSVYEANAAADGTRNAAFLDGHVKRLSAQEWTDAKAKSRIP